MKLTPEVLKKIIVASGFVSEKEFDEAAKVSSDLEKSILDVLIFKGLINEETAGKLIADYYQVPHANLSAKKLTSEIINVIPEKIARTYRLVSFDQKDTVLCVAMENPEDFEALEFVKRQTGLKVEIFYSSKEEIDKALGVYKKSINEDFKKIIAENIKKVSSDEDLLKAAEKLPVIKILDTILSYAISERASDVHIETMADEVIVRYRIDGMLKDIFKFQRGIETALVARIKILSNLKIDEHRIPQDGRHKFSVDQGGVSLRISIIPGFYGENVVMRILRESARPLSLEELGVVGKGLDIIKENITKPHGMILITGPTGSGKTTTLYSIMNIVNTIEVKICTIEDPIEYGMHRISQIQVNTKTGLDFAAGLRALLRHDPDIIMVGEIRDKETAEIAINSALTGHLVLSTLHTNTAAGAFPRFLDMGAEGFLLASTVNVVIAQRLVRKICSNCITKYDPEKSYKTQLEKDLGVSFEKQKFYKGKGCEKCNDKGYLGRIGIYEVLEVSEKIRELIVKGASSDEIQKQAVIEGMILMLNDGLDKVSSGQTTIEEVMRVVRENR